MKSLVDRNVLSLAFWGNSIIGSAVVGLICVVDTLLLLDVYYDLQISTMTFNRIMGPSLLVLLFWSECVMMAVVRQANAPPTFGRLIGYCLGIGHYLLFFLVWAVLRYCLRNYFAYLDGLHPGRIQGFSEFRFDYAIGCLCFFSHLLIRAWEKLWAVLVHERLPNA
jgi:hypothetical protein